MCSLQSFKRYYRSLTFVVFTDTCSLLLTSYRTSDLLYGMLVFLLGIDSWLVYYLEIITTKKM